MNGQPTQYDTWAAQINAVVTGVATALNIGNGGNNGSPAATTTATVAPQNPNPSVGNYTSVDNNTMMMLALVGVGIYLLARAK